MPTMKSSSVFTLRALAPFILFVASCGEPRTEGICYCEFFSGEDQQYDLRDLDRDAQQTECEKNDRNAANFGGGCELE